MKRVLMGSVLVGLVLCLAGTTSAQGLSAGVKGGVTFGSIPEFKDAFSSSGLDFSRRTGVVAGGFVTLSLLPGIAIQPELIYSEKGITVSSPGDPDWDVRLSYLDLPILLRLSSGVPGAKFYALVGPSINLKVHSKEELRGILSGLDDDLARFEYAAVVAVGVEVGRLLAEARWTEGLRSVGTVRDQDYRNRGYALMAGFRF